MAIVFFIINFCALSRNYFSLVSPIFLLRVFFFFLVTRYTFLFLRLNTMPIQDLSNHISIQILSLYYLWFFKVNVLFSPRCFHTIWMWNFPLESLAHKARRANVPGYWTNFKQEDMQLWRAMIRRRRKKRTIHAISSRVFDSMKATDKDDYTYRTHNHNATLTSILLCPSST